MRYQGPEVAVFTAAIYRASPLHVQEAMIGLRAACRKVLREGHAFERYRREAHETQWLAEQDLATYQWRMLEKVFRRASQMPFYRRTLRELGLDGRAPLTPEAFAAWPLLTKQQVRENRQQFVAGPLPPWHKLGGSTSGTTGSPLRVYQDLRSINREHAFARRQLEWAGYTRGRRLAFIRGDMIVPAATKVPPFWRHSRPDRMLMMSSYHLSETHAEDYLRALADFDPVVIQAYPSSVGFLANFLESRNREYAGRALRGVVTSSEALPEEARRRIERRFGCRVYDLYGNVEHVAAIGTCEQGAYHVLSDYGYVELLPDEDGTAEIVGTGFTNLVMPLLRYRTGDRVVPAQPGVRCACGRAFPLVREIRGRADDCIKTPDGRSVPMVAYNTLKYARNVAEAQIVQERIDEIRIRIVRFRDFNGKDAEWIKACVREKLGTEMRIELEFVDEIPRTRHGKLQAVISNM